MPLCPAIQNLNTAAVHWMSREAASLHISDIASPLPDVMRVLSACCSDEVNHMHEAAEAASSWPSAKGAAARHLQVLLAIFELVSSPTFRLISTSHVSSVQVVLDNIWQRIVASGSAVAVAASRVM
jgi:hypothetical protein